MRSGVEIPDWKSGDRGDGVASEVEDPLGEKVEKAEWE